MKVTSVSPLTGSVSALTAGAESTGMPRSRSASVSAATIREIRIVMSDF